jgi:choline dehydrogenase-like flavoprotein
MIDKASKSEHVKGKLARRVYPSPDQDLSDTKVARDAVYEWVMSEYHPIGSVALGDALDSRLRVKGTRNIRVADASIFPNHVSGNIVSSVYAVAEKAADIIKEDWDYAALAKAA